MATNFASIFGGGAPRETNRKKTSWGNLIQTGGGPNDLRSGDYGGSGLIYLGTDYSAGGGDMGAMPSGQSYAELDPYLAGTSQHGAWRDNSDRLSSQMDEVLGFSVDAYTELQGIYDQIAPKSWAQGGVAGGSDQFRPRSYGGSGDQDTASSNRRALEAGLHQHAQDRQKYDELMTQFNTSYTGAIQKRDSDAAAHSARLAELESQRQASEAASRRNQAWASNMGMQNRQNENVPETVTSGTAAESAAVEGGGSSPDDKRRRGRGSLSSNLGINV